MMADDPSDIALFKKAMCDVTPLPQDTHYFKTKQKPLKKSTNQPAAAQNILYAYDTSLMDQTAWLKSEEIAVFARPGLQEKLLKSLKAGKLPLEKHLDLHGHTANTAMALVDECFAYCIHHQIRSVLIIHGKNAKGLVQKPILKNILIQHLRENRNVLAYHSAQPKHGGTGALYVLLKKNNNPATGNNL